MKAVIKKEGLLIPRKFFKGVKEAEITTEDDKIIILPTKRDHDPLFTLGLRPGRSGLKDSSGNHDKYIYEKP